MPNEEKQSTKPQRLHVLSSNRLILSEFPHHQAVPPEALLPLSAEAARLAATASLVG
jgi:hypothetical protein